MKYLILLVILALSSCSSLKRQKVWGGLIGAVTMGSIAAHIGKELSPNPQSNNLNQAIGATAGGIVGLAIGMKTANYLWEEDPKNQQFSNLYEKSGNKIRVIRPKNIKRIKLETKLPSFLQGKVKEANVITYELESYEEETEDGGKVIHEPHRAYEYVIE